MAVAERRLRPLWDAIESRQYKSALKLASALQSKHPDAPYVVVLKALVLERLGKPEEALVLCRAAKDMEPVDDMTLKALQLVYQRLGRLEESTLSYEKACSKDPENVELLISLFSCHVRQYNYVKQQQVAMKLYKVTGDEKYLFWAVCSIYLQVRPGNAAEKQLLALAEALLKKNIRSSGLRELEGLHLYISLFLAQDRFEDALALVQGETGALFNIPVERLKLQGELLMRLNRFSEAAATYREILSMSSDDWTAIIQYINASLELPGDRSTVDEASALLSSLKLSADETLDRLEKVSDVFSSIQDPDTSEIKRAPFLAMVEIEYRRLQYGSRDAKATLSMALAESIVHFFSRFGHLAGFFLDVKSYVSALDSESQGWLVDKMSEKLSDLTSANESVYLRNEIAVCQVEEYTGHKRGGDGLEVVKRFVNLYKDNLKYSTDLDPEENILGEEFLVIAVNQLIKLLLESKQFVFFLEAAAVLEFGLSLRRFNARFKCMLVSLYSSICATTRALEWFRTLDVKNILLESASHHILPALLAAPCSPAVEVLLNDSLKFDEDSQLEVADMSIMTYRHGNYSKIVDFLELKERLENSHHYLSVQIEAAILSIKHKTEDLDAVEAALLKLENGNELLKRSSDSQLASLIFNEDLETRPWWSPAPDKNFLARSSAVSTQEIMSIFPTSKAEAQVTAADQVRWRESLRRRSLVPRLLFLTLNALSFEKDRNERCEEIKQHLESYAKSLDTKLDDFKADGKVNLDVAVDVKLSLLLFVLGQELASWSTSSEDKITNTMVMFAETLAASVTRLLDLCEDPMDFGTGIPALVKLVSEPILWLAVSVQAWTKRLQPSAKKKRRAATESSNDKNVSKIIEALRRLVASTALALEAVVSWSTKRSETREEAEVSGLLSLLKGGSGSGAVSLIEGPCLIDSSSQWTAQDFVARIVSSQRGALSGLAELCKSRLRILKAVKV